MEIFWDLFATLGKIGWGYITHGWLFAIAHLVILEQLIIRSWYRKIRLETSALEKWVPKSVDERRGQGLADTTPSDGVSDGETTQLLDQFVAESNKLGPQGFFVPMTDFSDRLDSIIDGMIGELQDRTNLFLLIGIAGTLFGLFEFAYKAVEVLQDVRIESGERVLELGKLLSSSMSKAFPIGFMGLVLTFAAQIFAAYPERRLRTALSGATRKALRGREEVSVSQVESIRLAMKPLEDLKETLTESVQPVVAEFGERLDQSLSLVKTQFNEMQKTTFSLKEAVESVNAGVGSLNSVAGSLEGLMSDTPKVLEGVTRLQIFQQASIEALDQSFQEHLVQTRALTFSLGETVKSLGKLPQEMALDNKLILDQLRVDSLALWREMSKDFGDELQRDYATLFDDIGNRVDEISASMATVSLGLKHVADDAGSALQSLRSLPASILAELSGAFGNLSEESLTAWRQMTSEFDQDLRSQYTSYISTIQEQTRKIQASLGGAAEEWQRVAQNAESILRDPIKEAIVEGKNEIAAGLMKLDRTLAERYPQAAQDVLKFTDDLRTMIGNVQELQTAFEGWLSEAGQAQDKIHEVYKALIQALDEIKVKGTPPADEVVPQLEGINRMLGRIQGNIPSSGNGVGGELQKSNQMLSQIRDDLNSLVNKEGLFGKIFKRKQA